MAFLRIFVFVAVMVTVLAFPTPRGGKDDDKENEAVPGGNTVNEGNHDESGSEASNESANTGSTNREKRKYSLILLF